MVHGFEVFLTPEEQGTGCVAGTLASSAATNKSFFFYRRRMFHSLRTAAVRDGGPSLHILVANSWMNLTANGSGRNDSTASDQ